MGTKTTLISTKYQWLQMEIIWEQHQDLQYSSGISAVLNCRAFIIAEQVRAEGADRSFSHQAKKAYSVSVATAQQPISSALKPGVVKLSAVRLQSLCGFCLLLLFQKSRESTAGPGQAKPRPGGEGGPHPAAASPTSPHEPLH